MSAGPSQPVADGLLALILNGTAYTAGHGPLFMQLHIADPGPVGTSNVAVNATREATSTWAGSNGSWSNAAAIVWTAVPASEAYTWFTLWTASTGGTFVATGEIVGGAVTSGSTFTLPIGDAVAHLNTAS